MHWYKHYLDAYARDTPELSITEHGAYRLLLDAYYSREGPLPCNKQLLYRICRAHRAHERKAVDLVVEVFFTNSDSTIKNTRADQEILKYQQHCIANRRPNRQRIVNESSQKLRYKKERGVGDSSESPTRVGQHLINKAPFLYKKPDEP